MVLLTGLADRLKFAPGDLKSLFAVVNCYSNSFIPEREHTTVHAMGSSLASLLVQCGWAGILPGEKRQAPRFTGYVPGGALVGGTSNGRVDVSCSFRHS